MKLQLSFGLAVLLVLLTLGSSDELKRDPQRDVWRCEEECQRQQPYFEEHLCKKRCQESKQIIMEVDGSNQGDAQEEYDRCQQRCPGSGKMQWQCQKRCQDEYETALERERERERKHDHEHPGREERHPREHDYTHCLRECERREEGFPRQRQCKLHCEVEFGRHRERHGHHQGKGGRRKGVDDNVHKTKTKGKKHGDNPYYFDSDSFESRYSTEEGQMKVLQRFSEKSELLLGIDKFRVSFYEANPYTFMLPHHSDADSVLFVIEGIAIVTLLKKENRETFNLERGDVLVIPAGTTAYLINSHKDDKLQIAELLRPVNTPGHFEQFFGLGGEGHKSFLNSFSVEVLQAALNIPMEQVEKVLKQQKEGAIVKASQEQVRGLAHKMSGRQFGVSSEGPFNLLDEPAQLSNEHGEFYEITPNDYQMLEKLDVSVGYCDIKQCSMMAPHYNSRTTYVVMVEEGSGYFEVVCPHLGSESNKKKGGDQTYKTVRSDLSRGDVFVIPAGHPVVLVASENENLKTIMFGINAQNNQRNFLAGQDNIINQLDEEAMELSFNMPAREVDEMFQKQEQSHFMAAPQQQKKDLVSILDFAGF